MNILYRLYTERVNLPLLEATIGGYFDGFTLVWSTGYWRGLRESSVIVEIVADGDARQRIYRLAEDIRKVNAQTAILVTETDIRSTFVTEGNTWQA